MKFYTTFMRTIKILLALILITFATSQDAFCHPHNGTKHHHNGPTIGAPLDGGILAVLGAAGVAYFVARKKGKNKTL
jgi:hypothetical protein